MFIYIIVITHCLWAYFHYLFFFGFLCFQKQIISKYRYSFFLPIPFDILFDFQCSQIIVNHTLLEKPLYFNPFGQTGLLTLAIK